ncbi:hypothetical protein D9758_010153 [Tetrapyrgos nigripes]|uniref:Uncharacterized protein n=1 Tax=Tetrapyrgos nigripes TaxID=182062 RepID=A0A8H5FRY3_9AGAR|nr:hypothetical protein D9758_010153 [Tetrapyrgos nigripes]
MFDLTIDSMASPEGQGILADNNMPSWTSIHVPESDDDKSSAYWSGDELRLDEILNMDNTGNFFIAKPASESSSQPLQDPSFAQQQSADHGDRNQLQNLENLTDQTVDVPNPAPQVHTLADRSVDASFLSKSRLTLSNDNTAATAGPATTTTNVDTPAPDPSSLDAQESQSHTFVSDAHQVQQSDSRKASSLRNTPNVGDETLASGLGSGVGKVLEEGNGMMSDSTTGKAREGSSRAGSASSTKRAVRSEKASQNGNGNETQSSAPVASTSASAKIAKPKKVQANLSAFGFLSSPNASTSTPTTSTPSSSSKLSFKPKKIPQKSFLGVYALSPLVGHSRKQSTPSLNDNSSPSRSSLSRNPRPSNHYRDNGNGGANIAVALSAAFTSNDHDNYVHSLDNRIPIGATKASSQNAPVLAVSSSDHSPLSPTSASSQSHSRSTKPTSTGSVGAAAGKFLGISSSSSTSAFPSASALTSPSSRSRTQNRPISSSKPNSKTAVTVINVDDDSDSDNPADDEADDIDLLNITHPHPHQLSPRGVPRTPSSRLAPSSWANNENVVDVDALDDHSLDPANTDSRAHARTQTSSSTPDPLALRTPDEDGSVNEDENEDEHGDTQPQPASALSNANANDIVNALSSAFASSIGTPRRARIASSTSTTTGAGLSRSRTRGAGADTIKLKISSPLAPSHRILSPSRRHISTRTRARTTRSQPGPGPASVSVSVSASASNPLADALTRAYADNAVTVATADSGGEDEGESDAYGDVDASMDIEDDIDLQEIRQISQEELDEYLDVMVDDGPTIEEVERILGGLEGDGDGDEGEGEGEEGVDESLGKVTVIQEQEKEEVQSGPSQTQQKFLQDNVAVVSFDADTLADVDVGVDTAPAPANADADATFALAVTTAVAVVVEEEEILVIETEGAAQARLDLEQEQELEAVVRFAVGGGGGVGVEVEEEIQTTEKAAVTEDQRENENERLELESEQLQQKRQQEQEQEEEQNPPEQQADRPHLQEHHDHQQKAEKQKRYQFERFQLMMDIKHLGADAGGVKAKWARLMEVQIEGEKEREMEREADADAGLGEGVDADTGKIAAELERELDLDLGAKEALISNEHEFEIQTQLAQRKLSFQYTSDGRSYTEQLFQRVEEWFGAEFLTVKALNGQRPQARKNGKQGRQSVFALFGYLSSCFSFSLLVVFFLFFFSWPYPFSPCPRSPFAFLSVHFIGAYTDTEHRYCQSRYEVSVTSPLAEPEPEPEPELRPERPSEAESEPESESFRRLHAPLGRVSVDARVQPRSQDIYIDEDESVVVDVDVLDEDFDEEEVELQLEATLPPDTSAPSSESTTTSRLRSRTSTRSQTHSRIQTPIAARQHHIRQAQNRSTATANNAVVGSEIGVGVQERAAGNGQGNGSAEPVGTRRKRARDDDRSRLAVVDTVIVDNVDSGSEDQQQQVNGIVEHVQGDRDEEDEDQGESAGENGRPAKRARTDVEPEPKSENVNEGQPQSKVKLDVAACPALMLRLLKGKTKIRDEEVEMIVQLFEILAGDDWSMVEQEAMNGLSEARDQLWQAIVGIAGVVPGSETLGIGAEREKRLVELARVVQSKFTGTY